MNELQQFGTYLRQLDPALFEPLVAEIRQAGHSYAEDEQVAEKILSSFRNIATAIEQDDREQLIEDSKRIGMERARNGYGIEEVLKSIEILRQFIWEHFLQFMQKRDSWLPTTVRHLEDFIHIYQITIATDFGIVLEQTREELHSQSQQLESQSATIREIGTPIMPVLEGVLVLPIVGVLDSYRATQVMERLLEAISTYQADIVIMDITGVPLVDTNVANYILQATRAAQLVGAEMVLVGVGAEIAQTMVHLGVELDNIITLANLQEGIQYAFEKQGITLHKGTTTNTITLRIGT